METAPPFEITDRSACDLCGICVKECCTNAKKIVGEDYTTEELMTEILKDQSFYESSGGGVTFSGGEPLMQAEFLFETLQACRDAGVHTAVETTGMAAEEDLLRAARSLDLIFYDVKHMDEKCHRQLTGASNRMILENLAALSKVHHNIIVRIPVIPGLNDSEENITKTAEYAADLGIGGLELLPYHNLGEVKYAQLGRTYTLTALKTPDENRMAELAETAREAIGNRNTVVTVMKSL